VARRSRSSLHPLWLIIGGLALLLVFALGAFLLLQTGEAYRTVAPLDVAAYLENSNSLRGNTYKVSGEVLNVLGYSPTQGRLISVGVDAKDDVIPMLIPTSLSEVNIQKGQKFIFLIEVTDQGILRARDLTKS